MPATNKPSGSKKKPAFYLALSFALPTAILGAVFAWNMVYPFGDRQILVTDFWQQYYPFFSDYWHKLREGGSLLWSWTNGVGTNYIALIAYYLASPLNLLTALVPHALLREAITTLVTLKIGLAGLFFAVFLRYQFRRADLSLPVFSLFYALCAFVMGYYWNIMWLDTFALLPLVVTGVSALIREGKWKLYAATLFLSVFINYYMGLFTCFYVVIIFFAFSLSEGVSREMFRKRFLQILLFSLLALAMTAVLTLPAFLALQNSYSAVNKFPTTPHLYESFFDILGNLIGFTPPTAKEGLPNLYSGIPCILLAGVFLGSGKIRLRERLTYLGILLFLLVSCNLNILNYIWHGFHFTNMLPYRFSFLVTFTLLYMSYRAFLLLEEELGRRELIAAGAACVVALVSGLIGPQSILAVAGTALIAALYMGVALLFAHRQMSRGAMLQALLCIALVEIVPFVNIGVKKVETTSRDAYPLQYEQVREALALRQDDGEPFYRTEFSTFSTLNDSALYHIPGVSLFSSTANVNATNFMGNLGLPAWDAGNRYYYLETSPVTNMFLNVKYLITRNGVPPADGGAIWEEVHQSGEVALYRNRYHLPFGFVADKGLLDYTPHPDNVFESQNALFRAATGHDQELFRQVPPTVILADNYDIYTNDLGDFEYAAKDPANLPEEEQKWTLLTEMPEPGLLYAFVHVVGDHGVEAGLYGEEQRSLHGRLPYILCAGKYAQGDEISLSMTIDGGIEKGNMKAIFAYLDQDVLQAGYEALRERQGGFQVASWRDSEIRGEAVLREAGVLYLPIPYEAGWSAWVDGNQREIGLLDGSMAALELAEGTHEITLRYQTPGLAVGAAISGAAFLLLAATALLQRRQRTKASQPVKEPAQGAPDPDSSCDAEPQST